MDIPSPGNLSLVPAKIGRAALALILAGCITRPAPVTGSGTAAGTLRISDAVAWGLASAGSSSIGFRTSCPDGDTLTSVGSPDGTALLHRTETGGAMAGLEAVVCDSSAGVTLGPGLDHVMITGTTHGFGRGDSVTVTLRWQRSGDMTFRVPIVRYSDAVQLLGR